ncbi:ParB N-terminal domain-containing protein [Comamonas sp. w2-DMI]|uniref:ParB/RepB/Spo0J family partition protein n=1 Tax=Comamonas sp. w2-DMI TaxID=3126391 RepID=UPI0032E45C9C
MAIPQSLKSLHVHMGNDAKQKGITDEDPMITKGSGFSIAPELLEEEEDFNTRGAFIGKEEYFSQPEVVDEIRKLADAYKRGDMVPAIIVKVKDGRVLVRDGHRRRRAILLAKSEGADIKRIRVEEQSGDEDAQTLLIVTSNNGAPLSVLERAVVFDRLNKAFGWKISEIATRAGVTQENVRQLLKMMELPLELKKMIQRKEVSATYAMELFAEHGTNATQMIKDELAKKPESGSSADSKKPKKVTKKSMESTPRLTRKVVTQLHSSFVSLTTRLEQAKPTTKGTFMLEISNEDMEMLQKLKSEMAAKEAPETNPDQMELV